MLISELSVKIMDEFVKMKKALKLKLKPNVTSKAKTERLMLRIFDENIYAWLDPSRPVREVVPNGGNVVAFLKRKRNPKPAADVAEEPATDDDEDNIAGTEEEGGTDDEEREENDEDGSDSDSDSEAEADDGESGKCLAVRP